MAEKLKHICQECLEKFHKEELMIVESKKSSRSIYCKECVKKLKFSNLKIKQL